MVIDSSPPLFKKSFLLAIALHILLFAFCFFYTPSVIKESAEHQPMIMELVQVADVTNIKPRQAAAIDKIKNMSVRSEPTNKIKEPEPELKPQRTDEIKEQNLANVLKATEMAPLENAPQKKPTQDASSSIPPKQQQSLEQDDKKTVHQQKMQQKIERELKLNPTKAEITQAPIKIVKELVKNKDSKSDSKSVPEISPKNKAPVKITKKVIEEKNRKIDNTHKKRSKNDQKTIKNSPNKSDKNREDADYEKMIFKSLESSEALKTESLEEIFDSISNSSEAFDPSSEISMSEVDAIRQQIKNAWNLMAFSGNTEVMRVSVLIQLDKSGAVIDLKPKLGNSTGSSYNAFVESVLRAISKASPLQSLSAQHFHLWREIEMTFSSDGMLS